MMRVWCVSRLSIRRPGEHVGAEPREPALDAGPDGRVEQDRAEPPSLVAVFQHERDLTRPLLVGGLVAAHADDLDAGNSFPLGYQGEPAAIVDVGEVVGQVGGRRRMTVKKRW